MDDLIVVTIIIMRKPSLFHNCDGGLALRHPKWSIEHLAFNVGTSVCAAVPF